MPDRRKKRIIGMRISVTRAFREPQGALRGGKASIGTEARALQAGSLASRGARAGLLGLAILAQAAGSAGAVVLEGNQIDANTAVEDRRVTKP